MSVSPGPAAPWPKFGALTGLLASTGLLAVTVLATGRWSDFFDPAALVFVIGGTLTVTATGSGLSGLTEAFRVISRLLVRAPPRDATMLAAELVRLARLARRDGLLGLEKLAPSFSDLPILQRGLDLLLEGRDTPSLERILREEIRARAVVFERTAAVLRQAAEVAPAMGLLGTLVGLVRMLAALDAPDQIGPGLAVALLTTFYGAFLAYAVLAPLVRHLARCWDEEALLAAMQLETVLSIGRRENPRLLAGLLASLMPAPETARAQLAQLTES